MTNNNSSSESARAARPSQWAALGALGVVFGDLGTSPLYTLQTVVQATGGQFTPQSALGVLSLMFWTLIVTISIKYCLFVMRADNHGEGGILALMSLIGANGFTPGFRLLTGMGLLGAALIYGDGVITPAISVLSALEGVNVVTETFKPYVMPMAVVILLVLFAAQRFGTEKIGRAFGPVMLLWFIVIAAAGHGIDLAPSRRHRGDRSALCGALHGAFGARRVSWCWAACFYASRAAKRCTRTWVISARGRFVGPGTAWCCRRCC